MTDKVAPMAAALMALAAFACCVPLGLVGAIGVLSVSSMFAGAQQWFLFGAAVLLALAAWVTIRRRATCKRSVTRFSLLVLGCSAAVVVGVLVFPQVVAGLIADTIL